jgi:nucleoside-diphosphate-sugar epimerase
VTSNGNLIFILGGKGFVGSAFARFCQVNNKDHVVIDRKNYDSYKGRSCDIFINANGNSSKVLATKDPMEDFDATVQSTRKSLLDFQFKKYILISSGDVYPDYMSSEKTKEDSEIDVTRESTYGFHKYLTEECVRHGSSDWLVVRLGGMVGIGLKKNPIFDIINGGPIWLDSQSELQYMNTDDVAKTVFKLINNGLTNEIFNICGRGLVKLQKLLDIYNVKVNPNSPIVKYDVNIEKIQKITEIPDSMETVMNFIKNVKQVRT